MEKLKKQRKALHLTQEQLANETGVSLSLIWKIENGERKPSVKIAKRIANVLGFPWTDFYEEPT